MSTFGPLTKAQLIDAMPERNGFTRKKSIETIERWRRYDSGL